MPGRIRFFGHSTVLAEIDGVRLLFDPLLRNRILFLAWRGAPIGSAELGPLDAILISHQHSDHLDVPSLRKLDAETPVITGPGSGRLVRKASFEDVRELQVGDRLPVGAVEVEAVYAEHKGQRWPWTKGADAIGFVVHGSRSIYFAGDTDHFDDLGRIGEGLDVALIPVWGWGTSVGVGHLDPRSAAQALRVLQPRLAIPIHWGGLAPVTRRGRRPELLWQPPQEFARIAAEIAPEVEVRVLEPGESTEFD
jgi:L-ascorbate metabolism protein UlaG (beta-lactamase superfamily)